MRKINMKDRSDVMKPACRLSSTKNGWLHYRL
jgi:hypothetical protein